MFCNKIKVKPVIIKYNFKYLRYKGFFGDLTWNTKNNILY